MYIAYVAGTCHFCLIRDLIILTMQLLFKKFSDGACNRPLRQYEGCMTVGCGLIDCLDPAAIYRSNLTSNLSPVESLLFSELKIS
jgi:hypothetical protein